MWTATPSPASSASWPRCAPTRAPRADARPPRSKPSSEQADRPPRVAREVEERRGDDAEDEARGAEQDRDRGDLGVGSNRATSLGGRRLGLGRRVIGGLLVVSLL